jgi:hypothetical protein
MVQNNSNVFHYEFLCNYLMYVNMFIYAYFTEMIEEAWGEELGCFIITR